MVGGKAAVEAADVTCTPVGCSAWLGALDSVSEHCISEVSADNESRQRGDKRGKCPRGSGGREGKLNECSENERSREDDTEMKALQRVINHLTHKPGGTNLPA